VTILGHDDAHTEKEKKKKEEKMKRREERHFRV
jgi:hypothetical protein